MQGVTCNCQIKSQRLLSITSWANLGLILALPWHRNENRSFSRSMSLSENCSGSSSGIRSMAPPTQGSDAAMVKVGPPSRILNAQEKPRATAKHMLAAVKIFERWLIDSVHKISRKVEEIPPPQLNIYLKDFFSSVKKVDGTEYNPVSLSTLRSSLDRYLREYNYPCSIVRSEDFLSSQLAYKDRLQKLKLSNLQNQYHPEDFSFLSD